MGLEGLSSSFSSTASSRRQPGVGTEAAGNGPAALSRTADNPTADSPDYPAGTTNLSPDALAEISKLKARDTEVRQHELAHLAASGGLAISGASFTYQKGPDGVNYAVGGEVQIDTSPGSTPEETITRARTIQTAALAPAEPSSADRAVAAQAQQMELQARAEAAAQAASASQADTTDQRDKLNRAYGNQAAPASLLNVYA